MKSIKGSHKNRLAIANLAAKYISVDGINDYQVAKNKAAEKLGYPQTRFLPNNIEIEKALSEYQRLFHKDSHQASLYRQRDHALGIMRHFHEYSPYLAGPVLTGTATRYSEITIFLYTDTPEDICIRLMEYGIEFTNCERRIKTNTQNVVYMPAFKFMADTFEFLLIVFPENRKAHSPFSPVNDRPMERASIVKLENLLNKQQEISN